MLFLVPAAAIFALTIPVVILLYFLKLKRLRTEVSSTILWRRSIEDLMANAPFQRLRRNLLLILQILALLFAVLALMRPFLHWAGGAEQNFILLIDRSASMQATDAAPSRLEAAKQHALRLVEDMSRGDRMAVLAFSDHAEVVQSLTDDRAALRQAIVAIRPTDAPTRLAESLAIARALALANKNSEIFLISDGALSERNLSLDDLPNVAFIGVGERGDNIGIVDLDLRQSLGRQTAGELFVGVRSFSNRARKTTLRLLLDGRLTDAKEVALEPQASRSAVFRNLTASSGTVEVRLDGDDDLAVDNVARGVLDLKRDTDILLVTEGNYFLERLLALHSDFRVAAVKPSAYSPERRHDIAVLDDWSPNPLPPGNYLMFHTPPPLSGVIATTGTLTNPLIVDWHRLHPLTRYVNFEPVNIQRAARIVAPGWAQVLAESLDAPMIVLFEDRQVRCLYVAFNIQDSDWPLHISFPVFLSNAVRWLAARSAAETRLSYRTGETLRVTARGGRRDVVVQTPDETQTRVEIGPGGEGYFAATDRVGLYTARSDDKSVERFAFNLLSETESNTSPTKVLSFAGRILESQPQGVRSNFEIWFWLALAALIVLVVEWLIYCKRSAL